MVADLVVRRRTISPVGGLVRNPDFVDVVIHAYRLMFGNAAGDATLRTPEDRLAALPAIGVPAITIDGSVDPLKPGGTADHARCFPARRGHRVVDAGHNVPMEAPGVFADAVSTVRCWIRSG